MVLGNTFHLHLEPGDELIARQGGLHRFMRWDAPIITDSGGFQVFSMGHGTVADEIKGRAPSGTERAGRILEIGEQGVRYRSYLDGSRAVHGARDERWRSRRTSARTSRSSSTSARRSTSTASTPRARPSAPIAGSTRCLDWHAAHGPEDQVVYGIVQGGVHEDLRVASAADDRGQRLRRASRSAARSATDKPQMYEVVGWTTAVLPDERPRHLLGIGEIDDLIAGVELGIDTFDCAMPTRLGRHGMALVPDPERRWRVDLTAARWTDSEEPLMDGCPCPACAIGYTRGYLRYMTKARELTAQRLVTLHNLAFVERVVRRLRGAVLGGTLARAAAALRAGEAP